MPFPSPPWHLRARAWVSVFALRGTGRPDRPAGVYAAAFVDYQAGGVLTYHELLVARLVREGRRPAVRITDIWVDSEESLAGGRSLWAIPKQAADLALDEVPGPLARTRVQATAEGAPVASASFSTVPGAALLRVPFATRTSQTRGGTVLLTAFAGSGRAVPCRASWRFDPAGPLAFLAGRRPLVSAHLRDARLRFG